MFGFRKFILENTTILSVVYCPKETFNIGVETAILILQKRKFKSSKRKIKVFDYDKNFKLTRYGEISQSVFFKDPNYKLNFRLSGEHLNIIEKMEKDSNLF